MSQNNPKPTLQKQQLVNLSLDEKMLNPELTPQVGGGATPSIAITIRVSYQVCTRRVCGKAYANEPDQE